MFVQCIMPRVGQEVQLSCVTTLSGGSVGLDAKVLQDMLRLLRNREAGTSAVKGDSAGELNTRVLKDLQLVSQLTPEQLLSGLGALPADPAVETKLQGLGPDLREAREVSLTTEDWSVLQRPVVTARGLVDSALLDLFALRVTYLARDAAAAVISTTPACSPIVVPTHALQLLQRLDDATRRAWEAGFTEVLQGWEVRLDDAARVTLTVRVAEHFPAPSDDPVERARQWARFPAIEELGASCQQVAAVCLSLVLSPGRLVLLDEPALHLHPLEAWRLGAWIGRFARSADNQIMIANNNPSFVGGLMASYRGVTVLQVNARDATGVLEVIRATDVERLAASTLLSNRAIARCLFSRRVIVAPTAEDREVYERVAQRQFGRYDIAFIHSHGPQNLPEILRVLASAKIPACVIGELELLGSPRAFSELIEATSGTEAEATWLGTCDKFTRMLEDPVSDEGTGFGIRQMETELRKISSGQTLDVDEATANISDQGGEYVHKKRLRLRENGLDAIDDDFRPWVEQLMDELRSSGVFIAAGGRLQGWIDFGVPLLPEDWLFNALQEIDRGECPVPLETFVGEMLDHLDAAGRQD